MEISPDILENLKCGSCENYLSRGPIYLEQGKTSLCSQCVSPKHSVTRNLQYEIVAKLLMFPCKNRDLGCSEKVPFAEGSEIISHEEVCPFRQYVCPIFGSARCDWLGFDNELVQHCEEKHSNRVQGNPCVLSHDISKSVDRNFLLRAFEVLFLLHTKVCLTSGRIYHSVRYLGLSENARNFSFNLDIKRKSVTISKKGCVAKQGCLAIQEDTSQAMKINSLLDLLDGFEGTTFTVTLERSTEVINNCVKCGVLVTALQYRTTEGWWCIRCAPLKLNCYFKSFGCTYHDMSDPKLEKHKWYFCTQAVYCNLCQSKMPRGSLLEHYICEHQHDTYDVGSIWRMKWSKVAKRIVLNCIAGKSLCRYFFKDKKINLEIFLPISSERLHEFKCSVRILQTTTGTVRNYKPDVTYDMSYDWIVKVTETDFPSWSYEFDVSVDISRTEM